MDQVHIHHDYELAITHIEKLLDRRQITTTFYLSVNTGIAAAVGLIINNNQLSGWWLIGALLLLIVTGVIACIIWRSLLLQYQVMLDWWYTQVRDLEAMTPESTRLFSREYQELILDDKDNGSKSKAKIGLTSRELALNWVFLSVYFALGVSIVIFSFWR